MEFHNINRSSKRSSSRFMTANSNSHNNYDSSNQFHSAVSFPILADSPDVPTGSKPLIEEEEKEAYFTTSPLKKDNANIMRPN